MTRYFVLADIRVRTRSGFGLFCVRAPVDLKGGPNKSNAEECGRRSLIFFDVVDHGEIPKKDRKNESERTIQGASTIPVRLFRIMSCVPFT